MEKLTEELIKNKCKVKFCKKKFYLWFYNKDKDICFWNEKGYWKKENVDIEKEKDNFASDVIINETLRKIWIKQK